MKSASPRSFFCLGEWPYLPLPARLRHNTKRKTSCGSALFPLARCEAKSGRARRWSGTSFVSRASDDRRARGER